MDSRFWWRFLSALRHTEVIFGSTIWTPDFDVEAAREPAAECAGETLHLTIERRCRIS